MHFPRKEPAESSLITTTATTAKPLIIIIMEGIYNSSSMWLKAPNNINRTQEDDRNDRKEGKTSYLCIDIAKQMSSGYDKCQQD